MKEYMYNTSSVLIAVVLFLSMLMAIEIGYRIGRRYVIVANEAIKSHVNGIQASMIGLLALLLGFTFSLSLQRFDERSNAVVEEANAIGTTYLRAQLLPTEVRQESLQMLSTYVDVRVEASSVSLAEEAHRQALLDKANKLQAQLWRKALLAAELAPNPVTTGLYIQTLNDMIDSLSKRDAALHRHVPELVLLLLYVTFLIAGSIVGFAAGESNHRPSFASYLMVVLMVILVYIILDLDRPRRGLIEVSQAPLLNLQATIQQEAKEQKN